MPSFWDYAKGRLAASFDQLDRDSVERRKADEINRFNRPTYLAVLLVSLVANLVGLAICLKPPADVAELFKADPDGFHFVRNGTVFFSEGPTASEEHVRFPITLPDRNIQRHPGFDVKKIWYEFPVEVPEAKFVSGRTGLLTPKVFGNAEFYWNGKRMAFAKNYNGSFLLDSPRGILRIKVAGITAYRFGIRATYPILLGDLDKLLEIPEHIERQVRSSHRATSLQYLISIVLTALFLVVPARPELFAFILYSIANTITSFFYAVIIEGSEPVFSSLLSRNIVEVVLESLTAFLLFYFVLAFFRLKTERLNRLALFSLIGAIATTIICAICFGRTLPQLEFWKTLQLYWKGYFLVCTFAFSIWICLYLAMYRRLALRTVIGLLILIGVFYAFAMGAYDAFFYFQGVSGESRNHLLVCLIMMLVVFVEYLEGLNNLRYGATSAAKTLDLRLPAGKGENEFHTLRRWFLELGENWSRDKTKLRDFEIQAAEFRIARQVAHDIRSPLAALRAAERDLDHLPNESKELIKSAAVRIREISEDLLCRKYADNSSIKVSVLPLRRESVISLVSAVVREKEGIFKDTAKIKFSAAIDTSPSHEFALVDANNFKRVISNLIDNAVEARRGSVSTVEIEVLPAAAFVVVRISDDGVGISDESIAHLGVEGASFKKVNGFGLGLFHAKRTVEGWGGSLEVSSKSGQGTVVVLKLPRA